LAGGFEVAVKIGGWFGYGIAGEPEDREAAKAEQDAHDGPVEQDPIGRPEMENLQPAGRDRLGIVVADRRPAPPALQENHRLPRRADAVDEAAGQPSVLVVHQRHIQQERPVGHEQHLALLDGQPAHQHVAFRFQKDLGIRVGNQPAVKLNPQPRWVDVFEPGPLTLKRADPPRPVPALHREPAAVLVWSNAHARDRKPELGPPLKVLDFRLFARRDAGQDRLPVARLGVEVPAHVDQRAAAIFREPVFEPVGDRFRWHVEIVGKPDDHVGPLADLG